MECGQGIGTNDKVTKRGQYYLEWLNYFNLPTETDLDCGNQPAGQFPTGGTGDVYQFYDKDWSL